MTKHTIAIARAVAVIGSAVAVTIGITFAAEQSNTVALSPNNLVSSTASIAVGAGTSCPGGNTTTTAGFTSTTPLVPGGPAVTTSFCLDNTGNIPLLLSASVPTLPGGVAARDTVLSITCSSNQGSLLSNTQTLSAFASSAFTNPLPAGAVDNCTASATLNADYTGSGGEAIPSFDIDFVGNQVSS